MVCGPLVLFLCRTNATCSILAEAILKHRAKSRLCAASGGEPRNDTPLNPFALECLSAHGIATQGLRTKVWGEFFGFGKPPVRFVIALSDVYAAKSYWGQDTLVAHWQMPDPGEVASSDTDIRVAFELAYADLELRIQLFLALPLERLNNQSLAQELKRIGGGTPVIRFSSACRRFLTIVGSTQTGYRSCIRRAK